MSDASLIDGPGTEEAVWASWAALAHLPVLDTSGWTKVVVVAAHPDDEVLGVGGTMALLAASGVQVHLVAVTDGEGSHPRSAAMAPGELAARRVRETADALAALALDGIHVVRMRLPDSGLGDCAERIARALAGIAEGADACLAPWSADAHIDHEVCGAAARNVGAAGGVPVYEFPIWAWHWSFPDDPRVPWSQAARIPLPADVLSRKRTAISRFESQIRPIGPGPEDAAILPPGTLAHFQRPFEVVFG